MRLILTLDAQKRQPLPLTFFLFFFPDEDVALKKRGFWCVLNGSTGYLLHILLQKAKIRVQMFSCHFFRE
jgi:hypothetical protein